jgi:hypothetical protein
MKKWTIMIASILITMSVTGCVYATENVNVQLDELPNNGRIVINFQVMDTEQISSPVENVTIEMSYLYDDKIVDINNMEELKNTTINLVSDANGVIVLNNLPYGVYQYRILSAPDGLEYNNELSYIGVDLLDNNVNIDELMTRKVQMAEGNTIEEIPEDKNDTIKENVVEQEEIITDEENQDEVVVTIDNSNALKTNINTLSQEIYNYEEDTTTVINEETNVDNDNNQENIEKNKIIKNTISSAAEKFKMSYKDMLKGFKEYRLSSSIKIAISTIDNSINEYFKLIANLPEDEKYKKIKRINNFGIKIIDIHNQKKNYNLILKSRIR